ncbi:kinesin-like protein subito [Culicoides brevitarsis]|uniref:kinesin-like protein subito n=1 Tax=Culicoides brevitarsis TaxID=469753 RepID=UPI00307BDE78
MEPPTGDSFMKNEHKRKVPSYIQPRDPSIDRRYRPCPKRQVNLERVIQEEELNGLDIDLTEDEEDEKCSSEENKVAVYLRLRPHPQTDRAKYHVRENDFVVVGEEGGTAKRELTEKHYSFSKIFGNAVSQSEIYENCIRAHLNDVTTDVGATFLTYGTSGSGKTFTLLGSDNDPGIVARSIEQIFTQYGRYISDFPMIKVDRRIDQVSMLTDDAAQNEVAITEFIKGQVDNVSPRNYQNLYEIIQKAHLFEETQDPSIASINVWVSYVEIYNEKVRDLLDVDETQANLQIISNDGESFIKNVQWVFAPNAETCHAIMEFGSLRASYGQTAINDCSSRSHSVFYINVVTITKQNEVSYANYKFCDLAGSERVKKAETQGGRLKETQKINTSLMTLGRCLSAVHANQKAKRIVEVVPVRDSKLTLLIQAALTARERLTMIVNLLPITEYYDENMNVLAFSSIAKQIHVRKPETRMAKRQSMRFSYSINAFTSPTRHKVDHVECELERERLNDEIAHLQEELNLANARLFTQEMDIRNSIVQNYEELLKKRDIENKRKIESAKEAVSRPFEARVNMLKRKIVNYEEDIEELTDKYEDLEEKYQKLKKWALKNGLENGEAKAICKEEEVEEIL